MPLKTQFCPINIYTHNFIHTTYLYNSYTCSFYVLELLERLYCLFIGYYEFVKPFYVCVCVCTAKAKR